jgi:hypothetical protein
MGSPGRRSPEVIFEGIKRRNCPDSSIVSLWGFLQTDAIWFFKDFHSGNFPAYQRIWRFKMKRTALIIVVASFLMISATPPDTQWQKDYKLALENLEKQDLISSLYFIDIAMNSNDIPSLDVIGEDGKKFDYLPYYYLGIIYFKMGKYPLALSSFDLSEKSGLIKQRPSLYENLKKYRLFVNNKLILQVSDTPPQISKTEEKQIQARKKFLTDEYEETMPAQRDIANQLKGREERLLHAVRKELGLPNEPIGIYPWYFYYERAMKYIEENQWHEAMLYLSESLLRKSEPKLNARRYGVWFKDYTPYLYLAYVAMELDNIAIAKEAFQISKSYAIADPSDPIYEKVKAGLK